MQILPIISTLRRHRTAATLIVLEIALTCAIVSNTVFLIGDRIGRMNRPSGIVEDEIVHIDLSVIGKDANAKAVTAQDLAVLRALPGVKSVANANMMPFGGSSWNSSVSNKPNDPEEPLNAAMYLGSPELLDTLGVKIIAGRGFKPEEYFGFEEFLQQKAPPTPVIVSRGVAETLFPNTNALGKQIYVFGENPQTIVGIIEHIARPSDTQMGSAGVRWSAVFPLTLPYTQGGTYVMRVDPARRHEVLAAGVTALEKVSPNRIIQRRGTFAEVRRERFKEDRSMAWLLVGVCGALLVITALGIVGLASFWVQQRTRQIGIRRALGATRRDIVHYFQLENFILATLGIVVGMALAHAVNLWLMDKYQVPRLPAQYLPIGASLLWLLGQIAVLGPALRAAAVPPAVATRTV